MMKLFKLIFLLSVVTVFSESQELAKPDKIVPEEYDPEEFPLWLHDVRRFEVVSLGTFPISFFATSLIYDFAVLAANNFSPDYSIGSQRSNSDVETILLTSIGVSLILGTIDAIININQRNKEVRAAEKKDAASGSSP